MRPGRAGRRPFVFRRNPALGGRCRPSATTTHRKYGEEKAGGVRLLNFRGPRADGGDYAYEVLIRGRPPQRQEISDAVSAEFGPVPLELVVESLRALEAIKVVSSQ